MSRGYAALGAGGVVLCGMFITYTTFQPELERQRAERLGEVPVQSPRNDKAISEAIMSDLEEAKQQVTAPEKGGFAWGIRRMLFAPKSESQPSSEKAGDFESGVKKSE